MEKEFIPYEQALALKELGFNEPCVNLYNKDTQELMYIPVESVVMIKISNHNTTNHCSAPLYQQVFRWFRNKHKLSGEIQSYQFKYSYLIIYDTLGDNTCKKIKYDFDSYEEAELECLKKLIEIVKNK